jgi:hypothetical protein
VAHSYRRTLPDNTVQRVLGWATSLGGAAPDVVVLTAQEKEAIDSSGGNKPIFGINTTADWTLSPLAFSSLLGKKKPLPFSRVYL